MILLLTPSDQTFCWQVLSESVGFSLHHVTDACPSITPPHTTLSCAHLLTVKAGDRVAQLVLERIATPDVVEVASLDDSQRGAGGFGSTGVSNKV